MHISMNATTTRTPYVPYAESTTTTTTTTTIRKTFKYTTTATATTITKPECHDIVDAPVQRIQFQEDDAVADDDGDVERIRQAKRRQHNNSNNNSNTTNGHERKCSYKCNMGANPRSNRCQREHKKIYRKHVATVSSSSSQLPSCKRDANGYDVADDDDDEIHSSDMLHKTAATNIHAHGSCQTQTHAGYVNGGDALSLGGEGRVEEDGAGVVRGDDRRGRGKVEGSGAQVDATKISLQNDMHLVGRLLSPSPSSSPSATIDLAPVAPTSVVSLTKSPLSKLVSSSSLSSTASLYITKTTNRTKATKSTLKTAASAATTATTMPHPCLKETISLSNKRQLVMPIEEEEPKDNENQAEEQRVAVGVEQKAEKENVEQDLEVEKEAHKDEEADADAVDTSMERMLMKTKAIKSHLKTPVQVEVNNASPATPKATTIQTQHNAQQTQRRPQYRLLSRPTFSSTSSSSLKFGMQEVLECLTTAITARRRNDLLLLISRVAHIRSSETTTEAITATTTSTATAMAPTPETALLGGNSQTTTFKLLDCRCFKDISDIRCCCCMEEKEKCEKENEEEDETLSVMGNSSREAGDRDVAAAVNADGGGLLRCSRIEVGHSCDQQHQRYQQQQQQQHVLSLRAFPPKQLQNVGMRCWSFVGDGLLASWSTSLMILALLMLSIAAPANCWTGRSDVPTNCTFPARWEGSWFLSGYQQSIHIKGSQFSYRGKCAASDGNKYLIVDEKGCHRCLVIYEKHKNVLQYKESECEGDSMYMHQTNPSALAMRSVLKQSGEHIRGGAHPNLNNNNNNNNGHSRLSSSDQYIMRSYDDMNDYFCKGRETLQNLCDQIPGDALLYSLFRESAEPVKCPLKGPFIFTYNRGHGECKSPVSNIESCTEDSRLLLSFQACPDVQGTESTVEELTCLATWKDGNSRYLVGLVSHHHAISNEERYRCFVYEKISSLMGGPSIVSSKDAEYKLAQSGDATCNGLDSAEVGSRIMSLRKPPLTERCDFPVWFKGPRHWHVLMGNAVYNYHSNDGSVHIIKPNGFMETRALCEQINKQTSTEMMAVVHYTTGCQSGFMCMMFYRRDTHVIEIQTGKQASRLEDACAPDHFDVNRMPYITLLASNPDPQICPMEGLYNLRGAIGPPYLTTRHKRNHNNKIHATHGHHHAPNQSEQSAVATRSSDGSENGGSSYAHKRHGLASERNRRDAVAKQLPQTNVTTNSNNNAAAAADVAPSAITSLEHMPILESTPLNWQNVSTPKRRRSRQDDGVEVKLARVKLMSTNKVATKTADADVDANGAADDDEAMRQRNRRDAPGCVTNYKAQRRLWVGCTDPDVIDVRPLCNGDGDEEYSCHGSWNENGTVYIIARHKGTKHGVCLSYRPTEGTAAKLVIGDACYRGNEKPPDHHLVANLTVFGKCGETGSAALHKRPNAWLIHLTLTGVAWFLFVLPAFNTR